MFVGERDGSRRVGTRDAAWKRRREGPREGHRRDCDQRLSRIGPRQGVLQPGAVRVVDDGVLVPARTTRRRGRTSRSSRTSGSRRRRCSDCSSPCSSASAWCRRKSSVAVSTRLIAKPVSRAQLVFGKYCGLTLTLAANMAVMAVALYAVLGYLAWGIPADMRAAWDAPALDSGAAQGAGLALRGADAGDGAGAVLLDVFLADAIRRVRPSASTSSVISARTCAISRACSIRRRQPGWRAP